MATLRLIIVGDGATHSTLLRKFGTNLLGLYAGASENDLQSCDGRQPPGTVLVVSYKTPLDILMLPEKMLTATALFEIKTPLEEDEVKNLRDLNKLPRIVQSIAALRDRPGPSLDDVYMENMPVHVIGRDRRLWEPSLGKSGFYSISEQSDGQFDSKYYLTVYAPVDRLTAELTTFASALASQPIAENYTIGQFATSQRYDTARKLSMRNVTLLGKEIASILGLTVDLVDDTVAMRRLDAKTGAVSHQTTANPVGISLFGHLLSVNYVGKNPTPVYPAVAIYSDCCHPGCGQGTPIAPLNPIDGMAWISSYRANFSPSAQLNPAMIGLTLHCGSGHESGTKVLNRSTTRYVGFCLGSLAGDTVDVKHPKIVRNYRPKDEVLEQLNKTYPQGNPVVLRHVFSSV